MAWNEFPVIPQLKKFWQRLRESIAQEVPERVAKCEFDCSRTECAASEIQACQERAEYELAERSSHAASASEQTGSQGG